MKKIIFYICVFLAIVGTIMPFVLYKIKHYWTASDMLSFYGACLSFLGTTILGFIATKQSKTANELAKKMQDEAIVKAGCGKYVIYRRDWLYEHIEQEYVLVLHLVLQQLLQQVFILML